MGMNSGRSALNDLVTRATALRNATARRIVIGIVGAPGAGKSTLAEALCSRVPHSVVLPMDGFHLSQRQLDSLGRSHRKGAPDTFDADGFVALLARVHERSGDVYAPFFAREIEEPIAAGIRIPQEAEIVIAEGNYLLHDGDGWSPVSRLLDEAWYVDPDPGVRRGRLVDRHRRFGRAEEDAHRWVAEVDEPNAVVIERARMRADLIVTAWDQDLDVLERQRS